MKLDIRIMEKDIGFFVEVRGAGESPGCIGRHFCFTKAEEVTAFLANGFKPDSRLRATDAESADDEMPF